MLAKVDNKKTETVINALIKQAHERPTELYKSPIWDRGKELADHQRFTLVTDIDSFRNKVTEVFGVVRSTL